MKKVINLEEVSDLTIDQLRRALCQVGYALFAEGIPTGVVLPEQPGPEVILANLTIEALDLPSARAYNLLKRDGINTVGELLEAGVGYLMDLRNMSEKCMDEYQVALAKLGYHDFTFEWPHEQGKNPPAEPVVYDNPATGAKRRGSPRQAVCEEGGHLFEAAPFGRLPKFCPEHKPGAKRTHVPGTCGRCSSPDHTVGQCPEPMPGSGSRRKEAAPEDPDAVRDDDLYITPRDMPSRPQSIKDDEPSDSLKHRRDTMIRVPGAEFHEGNETLGASAIELQQRWSRGLGIGYDIHPDVMALYGVDLDLVSSALDNPQHVEVRPESYDKDKRYVVLSFKRGDVTVILGCMTPARPKVIAVYVTSMLEHDTHRTDGAGGGGTKKHTGTPKTGGQVISRLRDLGADVDANPLEKIATVFYDGKEIGKIMQDGTREQADSDWNRMQRKINAIKS
jgi:hypothetical protein